MPRAILVINTGSSSLKFKLYRVVDAGLNNRFAGRACGHRQANRATSFASTPRATAPSFSWLRPTRNG